MPHVTRELCEPPQGKALLEGIVRNYVVHPEGGNSGPSKPRIVPGEETFWV
jgi:hypothetical protein